MPTIQARGLTKRFGRDVLAVDHLDFDAIPGGVTGFLGPNGAGKTTTLRMLLGLVTPTSGSVLIDGHECLDLVGLSEAGDRAVGGFSMGMRQRLELARAMLGKPDVLVLDEPANGLDPQGIAWLRDFLKLYASEGAAERDGGRIVIVSSHLLSEAQLIVDDVVVLTGGRLAAQGRLQDLLAGSKRSVRVRTPDAERLIQALHDAKLPAAARDGYVVCEGGTPEAVGPIMVENRIEVHEMVSSTESLESLFFALTGGEGMQLGHAAGRQVTTGDSTTVRRLRPRPRPRRRPPPGRLAVSDVRVAQSRDPQALDDLVDLCALRHRRADRPRVRFRPRLGSRRATRRQCRHRPAR